MRVLNRSFRGAPALLFVLAASFLVFAAIPESAAAPPGFDQAVQSYKAGSYSSALSQFQAIRQPDERTHYYMGLCLQRLNQVSRALSEYQWVVQYGSDPALKNNARIAIQQLNRYQATRSYAGQGNIFSGSSTGGAGLPRVIDFYTTWCGPCKKLAPILAQVESEYKGRVVFERRDAEAPENLDLVERFQIQAYPTVVFLDGGGRQVSKLIGVHPKTELSQHVERLLGR